jgi:glycosyltransferase involved in cell wall biosynthesis
MPKISVLSVCYNEEHMLPFFLRHYERFCSRIVVFDNYSTDSSWDILKSHPLVEAVRFDTGGHLSNDTFLSVKNHAWKKDVGGTDWQIVCDVDELIWHEDMPGLLDRYAADGVTLPRVAGFNMVADSFPLGDKRQLWEFIRMGAPHYRPSFNKRAVFRPTEGHHSRKGVREISYHSGCHSCRPDGVVVESPKTDIGLLHYRCFGEEYCLARARMNLGRMGTERDENGTKSWYQNQVNDYRKFSQLDKVYDVFGPAANLDEVWERGAHPTPNRVATQQVGPQRRAPINPTFIPTPLRIKGLRGSR